MRKLAVLVALTTVGALFAIAPAAAQTQDNSPFCQAALRADKGSTAAFASGKKPSQKVQQELDTAFTDLVNTAPPEVAANVQAAVDEIRTALQSGKEPSREVLAPNINAIDQYRYNSCGYQQIQVTGTEYEFQGLPKALPPGIVAIQFTDTGTELHMLDLFRIKTKDSVKKLLGLPEKEASKKIEEVGVVDLTSVSETGYVIADFTKPGRYGAACFFPVGSTTIEKAASGKGTPHWKKGMYQEIKVQARASTSTTG